MHTFSDKVSYCIFIMAIGCGIPVFRSLCVRYVHGHTGLFYFLWTCLLFVWKTRVGSSNVDAPMSKPEANRTMSILKEQSQPSTTIQTQIFLSRISTGILQLQEPDTNTVLSEYKIRMILFCCRGTNEGVQDCFSFTVKQCTEEGESFQCHVVKVGL